MRDKYENEVSFERMNQRLSKRTKFRDDDCEARFERKNQNRKSNHRKNREENDEYDCL